MAESDKFLLVWRGSINVSNLFSPWDGWKYICPFCKIAMIEAGTKVTSPTVPGGLSSTEHYHQCAICGWIHLSYDFDEPGAMTHGISYYGSALRRFAISDEGVLLDELGSHLKRSYADVFSLSWERFEDLARDVFLKSLNYEVIQTARSGDGGADLLLLSRDGKQIQAIVECKRYSSERRVGVSLVRQLVGACVRFDVKRATLVCTENLNADVVMMKSAEYRV